MAKAPVPLKLYATLEEQKWNQLSDKCRAIDRNTFARIQWSPSHRNEIYNQVQLFIDNRWAVGCSHGLKLRSLHFENLEQDFHPFK